MSSRTDDYSTYIASDEWKLRRVAALKRSMQNGSPACEVCGKHGIAYKKSRSALDPRERKFRVDGANGLNVHHLHYRTLGFEEPEDLIVLCTDICYLDDYYRLHPSQRRDHFPDRDGCHERCHDDLYFRRQVMQTAAGRCF